MKIDTFRSLRRAKTKSRYSSNLLFRPRLEFLEDRRLLSVTPAVAAAAVPAVADSSLSGFVYVDANNNGTKDGGEPAIGGVVVVLTGTTTGGAAVDLSKTTLADGSYDFANLVAGNYTITETQPTNYIEGKDEVGSQNSGTIKQTATTNVLGNITLAAEVAGINNDFGNLGETMATVSKRSFLDPSTPVVLTTVNSLSITKIDNAGGSSVTNIPGNVSAGQSLTYTVVVTNTGTANATGVTIADPVPSDFTSDTWTATATGGATGFSASGSGNIDDTHVALPVGSKITYVVTGTVLSTATGTFSNTATVTPSGGTAIPATDTDNLIDLSITKVDNAGGSSITPSTGNVSPGQSLTYTVIVTNSGPGNATGVTIADPVPSNFLSSTWTATSTGSATGFSASGSGNIDDTGVAMPAGSTITYVIAGTVSSTATGTISNTATVTPSGGTSNTATDKDNLPTLAITKVDNAGGSSITPSTGNVAPGQSLTYTVVVSNTGPGNSTGDTITDPIPSDLSGVTWTAASTGSVAATGFATSGSGNISQTGVGLPANSAITYTITGTVLSTATGTFSNTATVTPTSGTAKSATDKDNLANLSITKVDNAGGSSITPSTGNVTPGQSLTYTVVVSNTGPGNVTGATISDPIPADLTGDTWTAASTGSVAATGFATSGSGNINQSGVNLPANSAITYTITGTVLSTATGMFSNTATVDPPSGTPKTATDSDNLAHLAIVKFDNVGGSSITPSTGNVLQDQSMTYTVIVSNTGPGNVTGATITDPIPADLTGDTWTAASTGAVAATGFATSGSGNINQTGVSLPANSAITYTITGTVLSTATGTFSNTATATSSGISKSATDTDNVPNLSITKVDDAGGSSITPSIGNVLQGQSLTYTVVVSNTGPGSVTGATISDPIPADLTGDTWTAASTGSVAATGFATSGSGNISQTGVNLPANSAITYTITGKVSAAATGTFSNTATVDPPIGPPKTAMDSDNLPTLSITKTDNTGGSSITPSIGNVTNGQTLVYTITISNTGPGSVTGVSVSDPLPTSFTSNSYTTMLNGGAMDTTPTGSGITTLTDTVTLPAHSSIVYTVTGTLTIPTNTDNPVDSISNTVSETPPGGTPLTATDTDNVIRLGITKIDNANDSNVEPGQSLTYTVVVANHGTGTASGVKIGDPMPPNFTADTWTATSSTVPAASGFSASGTGDINDTGVTMPPGSSIIYTVTGTVSASATAGSTLMNIATATPAGGKPVTATDTDTVGVPDLTIAKSDSAGGLSSGTHGNLQPGQSLQYTIVVSNPGTGGVTGVLIADSFAAGYTVTGWTASNTGSTTASGFTTTETGNNPIDDTDVTMPAGSSITYVVSGTVNGTASGTLTNTANATPPVGSPVAATVIDDLPSLTITKIDSAGGSSITPTTGSAFEGFSLQYTIVVHNAGPGSAVGASITDTFPSGYTVTSWVATQTGGASGFSLSGSGNISDTATLPSGSSITYVVSGEPNTTGTLSNTAQASIGTFITTAVDEDNITEQIQIVRFSASSIASPAAASGVSTVPTAAHSATLQPAAVDVALAGQGRHSWQSSQQNVGRAEITALLFAAPAGGKGSSGSIKTSNSSSSATLVDKVLKNLHEPLIHAFG